MAALRKGDARPAATPAGPGPDTAALALAVVNAFDALRDVEALLVALSTAGFAIQPEAINVVADAMTARLAAAANAVAQLHEHLRAGSGGA